MSRNPFLLYMHKAFDCRILVDERLSHNVLWFSHQGLSGQSKGAFQNISAALGCLLKNFVLYEPF